MSILTFTGSLLTTIPTSADITSTSNLEQLSDVSVGGAAANALLKWTGSAWVAATTISPDTVTTTTLNTTTLNMAKLYFDSSLDVDMDHDVYYATATKTALSNSQSDRYLNLDISGLTGVNKSALTTNTNAPNLNSDMDGYSAQTKYSMKLNDAGTNDFQYSLGDIRFQYNYNASGNDNTDMAIRVYADGGESNIKVLRIKLGNQLSMGPDGVPGGGYTPSMGYLEWKSDRFDIRNHAGRIRLDTTAGQIRLQTDSGVLDLRSKSGDVNVRADSGTLNLTSDTSTIHMTAGTKIQMNSPLKLNQLTTTERDALTGELGFMIFNTTTNKAQVFTGSSWTDLH